MFIDFRLPADFTMKFLKSVVFPFKFNQVNKSAILRMTFRTQGF